MKTTIFTIILFFSVALYATELQIFNQNIRLIDNCKLEIQHSDGTVETKELPFKSAGKCVILPMSGTNVPRLEFIKSDYVFLVESQVQQDSSCRAELAAVIVSQDGKVIVGSRIQKTGTCGYGERKDYEILHYYATKNKGKE